MEQHRSTPYHINKHIIFHRNHAKIQCIAGFKVLLLARFISSMANILFIWISSSSTNNAIITFPIFNVNHLYRILLFTKTLCWYVHWDMPQKWIKHICITCLNTIRITIKQFECQDTNQHIFPRLICFRHDIIPLAIVANITCFFGLINPTLLY